MPLTGSQAYETTATSSPPAIERGENTAPESVGRPRVEGKYLTADGGRFWIKGVTYGTFMPNSAGELFPERERVRADFQAMRRAAINTVRTYLPPPEWLLDLAHAEGLKIIVGIYWEGRQCSFEEEEFFAEARAAVREAVLATAGHPAVLMYCLGNEIPPLIPRWHGKEKIERFIRSLYDLVKDLDPGALVTYANYPPTEFLDLSFLDVISFNVYLEREPEFRAYLARLQSLAGERPLLLSEMGLDTERGGLEAQAQILDWQLRAVFEKGLCGATVYAWTDEWAVGGKPIEDWKFGIVDAERRPKPALARVQAIYEADLIALRGTRWPRVTVVVASYNGGRTLPECLDSLLALNYPNVEIVVVDDGSTDDTRQILARYPVRVISVPNGGLSRARNLGIEAATGEIVAFTDSDCRVDPDWLTHLVLTLEEQRAAAVGGPNLPPPEDGWVAHCVARSPGNPVHVLLENEVAEHIPGCNMAYRKDALEAIGGFDPIYTSAGDDVDVCWKLLDRNDTIAFSPVAIVWHHRRPTVKGFLRQQRGYGRAEALLEAHYPERFNPLGYATWRGHIYDVLHQAVMSGGPLGWLRPRVYHGRFGEGLFQSVYQPSMTWWFQFFTMFEWQVAAGAAVGAAALSAVFWHPLLWILGPIAGASVGATLVSAMSAARLSCRDSRWSGWEAMRNGATVGLMHLLQPLARGIGRCTGVRIQKESFHHGGTENTEKGFDKSRPGIAMLMAGGTPAGAPTVAPLRVHRASVVNSGPRNSRPSVLPFARRLQSEAKFWDGAGARADWLRRLTEKLTRHGYRVQLDNGWQPWDLRVRSAVPFIAQLTSVVEMETVLRYRCTVRPRPRAYLFVAVAVAFLLALLQAPVLLPLAIPLLGMLVRLNRSQAQLEAALHQLAGQAACELQMVALEEAEERK